MKKKILVSFLIASLFACNTKKGADGSALLFGLLGGTDSPAATPTTVTEPAGNSFTVVSLDSTATNAVPTTTPSTESASSTAATPESTTTTIATTTTVNPVTPGSNFNFESNISVPITVTITSPGGPIANAPVTVSENTTNPANPNLLGSGNTNSQGTVSIPVSVPPSVVTVNVNVVGTNPSTGEVLNLSGPAPVQVPANSGSGSGSGSSTGGVTTVAPIVTINTDNFQAPQGCLPTIDQDCDGIANVFDAFPTNPNLGVKTESGRYTISFESLFPSAGDADLNDFTLVYSTEMHRAPDGKVKVLKGVFTVVGRGAGSRHELRLTLKVPSEATLTQTYLEGNDTRTVWNRCSATTKYAANTSDCKASTRLTTAELDRGILIMPDSQTTSYNVWNTRPPVNASNYRRGMTSQFEIVFDTPVDLSTSQNTVAGHLNWWIAFVRGGQTAPIWTIRRPGYETETRTCNGTPRLIDKYVECSGFPFSIIVPGVFNFPIEGGDIRRASTSGYADFAIWADSQGSLKREWYNNVTDSTKVVNIRSFYIQTSFSAYLVKAINQNLWAIASGLMLLGATLGYTLKSRWKKA